MDEKTELDGFRNIIQETVHFSSNKYRDALIEVVLFCDEFSLSELAMNQLDFRTVLQAPWAGQAALFEKCFNVTHMLSSISAIRMPEDESFMVLRKDNVAYDLDAM